MKKDTLQLMGIIFALTLWIGAGRTAQASIDVYYDRYFNFIDTTEEKLDTYAEKRYQKELAKAREIERKERARALAIQKAQEEAQQKALDEQTKRIADEEKRAYRRKIAETKRQKEKRKEIIAQNKIIEARATAIQLLALSGGDISKYATIPKQQVSATTQIDTGKVSKDTASKRAIVASRQAQASAEATRQRQAILDEQKRQAALAKAQAAIAAQKIAKAQKKKKKRSRRSRAS